MAEAIGGPAEDSGEPIQPIIGGPEPPHGPPALPSISVGMAFAPRTTANEAIAAKLTTEQLDKIVDRGVSESKDHHAERMETLLTFRHVTYALLLALVAIVFCFLYFGKPELLKDIIVFIFGAGVGAGGGYGYGRSTSNKGDASRAA